jgi:hypothetical protein
MSEHARPGDDALIKVIFKLEKGAWHGHGAESMWAESGGGDEYILRNVPFFAYGVSYGDKVRVRSGGDGLAVKKVIERSGHSTYRVFVADEAGFAARWPDLERTGCTFERATQRHYAIDVAPAADIYKVYEVLEDGKKSGAWDFEEGHCGHPLKSE